LIRGNQLGVLLFLGLGAITLTSGAQTVQENASTGTGAPADKPTAITAPDRQAVQPGKVQQPSAFHRKGGRVNREPTDTRIREEGIKIPPCARESREGLECAK
jgi:hypothetical protein